MAHRHGSRGMQQHQRAGQNALSGPHFSATPLRTNLTKCSPSLRVELVVGFVPRAGRVLTYGYMLVGWCRWGEPGTLAGSPVGRWRGALPQVAPTRRTSRQCNKK